MSFRCEYFYKYNEEKFQEQYFNFIEKSFLNENLQIQIICLNIFTKFIKYNFFNKKDQIVNFLQKDYFSSNSYYKRRIYFIFFESCLDHLSLNCIKESKILDTFLQFLNSSNTLSVSKTLKLLPRFYPLIADDIRLKFNIMNKLEELRNNLKDNLIKDLELQKVFNFFY